MNIIERIYKVSDFKGDSIYKISKEIGVSNGYFAKTRAKQGSVGSDIIEKIVSYYTDLNIEWLITGKGEMLKTKSEENLIKKNDKINDKEFDKKLKVKKTLSNEEVEAGVPIFYKDTSLGGEDYIGIPLIPIDAMAGFGEGDIQVMDYETSMYKVPEFEELKTDFMIRVKGSSMYPKYSSGDTVACKKLNIKDIFFQWNKVYVLSTEQGAIIKRVKKGSDNEHILLVSENPNYEPFELHLSQIYAIAIVIGVIRLE